MNEEEIKTLKELLTDKQEDRKRKQDWKNCVGCDSKGCYGLTDYVFDRYYLPMVAKVYGKALEESILYGSEVE